MCAPTDALLLAEELVIYIARKHGIPFVSKLKVWRFKRELREIYSRAIGDVVLKIIAETDAERECIAKMLAEQGISIASFIRSVPVKYEKELIDMHFLIRCAWICGLCVSDRTGSPKALEEALFLIADDLHKIPDAQFIKDRIWEKVQDRAEEFIIYDTPFVRLLISPMSMKYLMAAENFKK